METSKKFQLYRGVRYIDVILNLALLLQIPALMCIGTAHPYSRIGPPLLIW